MALRGCTRASYALVVVRVGTKSVFSPPNRALFANTNLIPSLLRFTEQPISPLQYSRACQHSIVSQVQEKKWRRWMRFRVSGRDLVQWSNVADRWPKNRLREVSTAPKIPNSCYLNPSHQASLEQLLVPVEPFST